MAKLVLSDVTSGYTAGTVINANNAATEAALENTLSRDCTAPNDMQADLDMGGFNITNLAAPVNPNDAARYQDVLDAVNDGELEIDLSADWPDLTNVPTLIQDIEALTDPGADRLLFWDDSDGNLVYLTLGTGLSIAGTTISASVASVAWTDVTSKPAYITSLALLADPGADRIVFWDDSATNLAHLTVSTGLAVTGTNLELSHLGIQSLSDPGADRVAFWDDSAGSVQWLTIGTNLTISGTTLAVSAVTGSFVATLTGVSGTVTGTIEYSVNGDVVTLEIPDITGTPSGTAHTLTGAPAAVQPTATQTVLGITTNNSVDAIGKLTIASSGVITLHNVLNAVFAGTGTEGVKACTVTYRKS
jgi:hypothetical protein